MTGTPSIGNPSSHPIHEPKRTSDHRGGPGHPPAAHPAGAPADHDPGMQSDASSARGRAGGDAHANLLANAPPPKMSLAEFRKAGGMKRGDKDASEKHDVHDLQQKLKDAGYYKGNVDGKYGKETADAVQKFQHDQGIHEDGKVGPQTKDKLGAMGKDKPDQSNAPAKPGADGQPAADGNAKPGSGQAEPPAADKVSDKVNKDLEAASHDWTASGYFGDIKKTLGEATSKADFGAVADAAEKGRQTKDHAPTIRAIGGADGQDVRNGLRDAYTNPRSAQGGLTAAVAAAKTPSDWKAIGAVAGRLKQEGFIKDIPPQVAGYFTP